MWKINRWIIDRIRSMDKFGLIAIDEEHLNYRPGPYWSRKKG